MPSPNSTFTELVTTGLREHPKMVIDNVSKNNALYSRLNKKGGIKTVIDGGNELVEPLDYAENGTYQRYSGYDTLNVQASDVLSAALYQWRQIALHVTASGEQIRKNSGKNQIIDLVEARIRNALRTFSNNFSSDIYSDGTATNQINGLQALVADAGTGTVGGIVSGTYTFWKNKVQSNASPLQGGGAVTISKSTIQTQWNNLWMELTRGGDKPDLIVCSNDYFNYYEESLTDLKRYTNDSDATGGFISLKYKTADVIFDGGTNGGGIPSAHAYFLNTDFMKLKVHRDANLTQVEDQRAVNQDAVVIPMIWMGNLTLSNRSLQGVHKA